MFHLSQLERLDIGSNDFDTLVNNTNSQSIIWCIHSFCLIKPEVIGYLTSLRELCAENNRIEFVPKVFIVILLSNLF